LAVAEPGLESSPRRVARIAGIWYALLAVFSFFSTMYVDPRFPTTAGGQSVADSIRSGGEFLFRLGILSTLAGQACFLFAGLAFHRLFEGTDRRQARSLLALVVSSVPIAFLNMLCKIAPLVLLRDSGFADALDPAQSQALASLFLGLYDYGIFIASVFWGLWLLPLGLLVIKSGYFPKVLGLLLLVNGAAYIASSSMAIVCPEARGASAPLFSILLIVGEIPFLLWLLIRGARVEAREGKAPALR
jgi:hypothetical protein